MKDLEGKTAFITGAASGIGFAMARAFGRAGMNIVVVDIDHALARRAAEMLTKDRIKAAAVRCDVTLRHDVERAALEAVIAFGKIHLVCNNAGVAAGGAFGAVPEKNWEWVIDVNLKGVVYGMETFVPLIKSHGEGGHIVNTASVAGLVSMPGLEPYTATKYAVLGMSEGWAQQLAPMGIDVSVLCPGFVRTRIHESGRARPARYGGQGELGAGVSPTQAEVTKNVLQGIDPDIVGSRVVEAVEAGEFYIFTHPEMRAVVEARFETIRAAFDTAENSQVLKARKH